MVRTCFIHREISIPVKNKGFTGINQELGEFERPREGRLKVLRTFLKR